MLENFCEWALPFTSTKNFDARDNLYQVTKKGLRMKRQRGRSRRSNNQNNSNRSLESNGPDVKVRGTAKQIFDKYETLARDAASSGNRVKAENCRQHAEHYLRIVNEIEAAKEKTRQETEATRTDTVDDSNNETKKDDNNSRKRYPPQVRKSSDKDPEKEPKSKVSETKAEPDTPDMESRENPDADKKDDTVKPKSSRRRKAPSRESSDQDDAATEAAE